MKFAYSRNSLKRPGEIWTLGKSISYFVSSQFIENCVAVEQSSIRIKFVLWLVKIQSATDLTFLLFQLQKHIILPNWMYIMHCQFERLWTSFSQKRSIHHAFILFKKRNHRKKMNMWIYEKRLRVEGQVNI